MNTIFLLPDNITIKQFDVVYEAEPSEFGKVTDEINITSDFKDLLIMMASYEAMMDIARQDKANMYKADINNELNMLLAFAKTKTANRGTT